MDRVDEALDVDLGGLGQGQLGDEVGHRGPDHVRADQRAGLGVPQHLHEAGGLAGGDRLAERAPRELADAHRDAALLGLGLGEADRRHLGVAVGAGRDRGVVDRDRRRAGDLLGDPHALGAGGVRQAATDHVADGPQAVAAAQVIVDDDEAALELDGVVLEAEALGVGLDAGRAQHDVGGQLGGAALGRIDRLDGDGGAIAGVGGAGDLVRELELDAAALEGLAEFGGDLGVLVGHQPRQVLDDGHLGAERVIEGRELDADGAGADHDQRLRLRRQGHRLAVLDDALAVEGDAGQRLGAGAGGEDDVARAERARAASVQRHVDLVRSPRTRTGRQGRGPGDVLDRVLLEEERDALGDAVGDVAAALDHRREVDLDRAGLEAELAGAVEQVEHLGGAQERLGRDAAPVEADAAELGLLDAGDPQPELRGADGGDVAAGARADDHDVVGRRRIGGGRGRGRGAHSDSDSGASSCSTITARSLAPSAPSITR